MNNLFTYRLILIVGQLCLLVTNLFWSFWELVGVTVWLICMLYLILNVTIQIVEPKAQQSRIMVVLDLLLWAVYFYFLGGVSNPLIWCLLIPSVLSALSQNVLFTWSVTVVANGLYLLLWAVTSESHGEHQMHDDMLQQHIMGMWLGFIAVSMLLTWVTTTLMQRINTTNKALVDYEKQRQADENILKMATLATSTAHELGTPLASIKLLVDELKLSINSEEYEKDFNLLDSQLMRCKKVLAELTAVTAKDRLDDSQLVPVVSFIEQLLASIDTNSCKVNLDIDPRFKVAIDVDALLYMACTNVLNNSISAGAKMINIGLTKQNGMILLTIEDDGLGQAHKNKEGLGIGLKLSTRILESIGGGLATEVSTTGAKTVLKIPVAVSSSELTPHSKGQYSWI